MRLTDMDDKKKRKCIWKATIRFIIYWVLFFMLAAYMLVLLSWKINPQNYSVISKYTAFLGGITALAGIVQVMFHNAFCYSFLSDPDRTLIPFEPLIDEMDRKIYEKSGGLIFESILYILVLLTCLTTLINEVAFGISFSAFMIASVIKFFAYLSARKKL